VSTATAEAKRIHLDERRFYELTLSGDHALLYVVEGQTDVAIPLAPQQIVELRAELAAALLALGPPKLPDTKDPGAHAAAVTFAAGFKQLVELDKVDPAEVDRIVLHIISHVRSWRSHLLTGMAAL
jgi:hypothetical protein